jgi:hypothetical protein
VRPGFIEVEKEFMNMGNEDIIYGNQGQPSASSRMVLDSSKERKEKGEPLI